MWGEPLVQSVEWVFPHQPAVDGPFVRGHVYVSGTGTFAGRDLHAFYSRTSRIAEQNGHEQAGARIELIASEDPAPDGTSREFRHAFDLWEGVPSVIMSAPLALPVATVAPASHRTEAIQELSEATLAGQKPRVLSLLQSLDGGIRDLLILTPKGKPVIYIDYATNGLLPLSAFGDGVKRAFFMALVLNSVEGGVLLIDEIESSLHVTALGSLFSWLVKSCETRNVQLFATTHSLEAVDAMLQAESHTLSAIAGYRLEMSKHGIQAQRLDGEMLQRLRNERGLDVRL